MALEWDEVEGETRRVDLDAEREADERAARANSEVPQAPVSRLLGSGAHVRNASAALASGAFVPVAVSAVPMVQVPAAGPETISAELLEPSLDEPPPEPAAGPAPAPAAAPAAALAAGAPSEPVSEPSVDLDWAPAAKESAPDWRATVRREPLSSKTAARDPAPSSEASPPNPSASSKKTFRVEPEKMEARAKADADRRRERHTPLVEGLVAEYTERMLIDEVPAARESCQGLAPGVREAGGTIAMRPVPASEPVMVSGSGEVVLSKIVGVGEEVEEARTEEPVPSVPEAETARRVTTVDGMPQRPPQELVAAPAMSDAPVTDAPPNTALSTGPMTAFPNASEPEVAADAEPAEKWFGEETGEQSLVPQAVDPKVSILEPPAHASHTFGSLPPVVVSPPPSSHAVSKRGLGTVWSAILAAGVLGGLAVGGILWLKADKDDASLAERTTTTATTTGCVAGVVPKGAKISVDGSAAPLSADPNGAFRAEGLAPGSHRLAISGPYHRPVTRDVTIFATKTCVDVGRVDMELEKGALVVKVSPADARVKVRLSTDPPSAAREVAKGERDLALKPGRYHVEVSAPDHVGAKRLVNVELGDEPVAVVIDLEPNASANAPPVPRKHAARRSAPAPRRKAAKKARPNQEEEDLVSPYGAAKPNGSKRKYH